MLQRIFVSGKIRIFNGINGLAFKSDRLLGPANGVPGLFVQSKGRPEAALRSINL